MANVLSAAPPRKAKSVVVLMVAPGLRNVAIQGTQTLNTTGMKASRPVEVSKINICDG